MHYRKVRWIRKFTQVSLVVAFAFLYYFYFDKKTTLIAWGIITLVFFVDLCLYHFTNIKCIYRFNERVPKKREEGKTPWPGELIFMISGLFLIWIFPKEVIFISFLAFVIADCFEQIIGIDFGSKPLFWNRDKNWEGTLGGFIVTLLGLLIINYFVAFDMNFQKIFLLAGIVALGGTSAKFDDEIMTWAASLFLTSF